MRKIRPRRKLYYSSAFNDIIHADDQYDCIQHVRPLETNNSNIHNKKISGLDVSCAKTRSRNKNVNPIDSSVCSKLCYLRNIPIQPSVDSFQDSIHNSEGIHEYITKQATVLKTRPTSKNAKCVEETLDDNHLLHCSEQIGTQELRSCSNEASLSTSMISKLPQLLDSPQNQVLYSLPQSESSYISDFCKNLSSVPKAQHKSKTHDLRRRRSLIDESVHNFNMDCNSNNIYQISKSFFQYSNDTKYSSHQEESHASISKWIEKKKENWRELAFLRESSLIVENQQLFCLQQMIPDILYSSPTQTSNQSQPSVPRSHFIEMDRKIPSSIHHLPDTDEFLQSHVKTRKSDVIDHIAPTKLPSRSCSRSKIVTEKSIHSFFSYNQQARQSDGMKIKPKESEDMFRRQQFRLKYIEEDSILSTNKTLPFAFEGVKKFSFSELSLQSLLDIRTKRKLNERKIQMMPPRSVLRYRTISSIMKKYRLKGGAIIPHIKNVNRSCTWELLSKGEFKKYNFVAQDLITKSNAPIVSSIKMKRKNKDVTRKKSPRSDLHHIDFLYRVSKSKTMMDYSCQIHLPLSKQIDQNNLGFSQLLSLFKMLQTISIEVRGELLHLQTKSSEIGKQGKVCCFDSDIANDKKIKLTEDNKDDVTDTLHKQEMKRRRRSSKERTDEGRKKKRKKKKRQKSIKQSSESKKRKRKTKTETKENSIDLIEVPSLQVGTTPMIITHSKYQITSIQNENEICRQQLLRQDIQVQMATDREVPCIAISNISTGKTPVVLPQNEADDEVNILSNRRVSQSKRSDYYASTCPLSTPKNFNPPQDNSTIQKIANGKNTPSEFGNQEHFDSLRNHEVKISSSKKARRLTYNAAEPDIQNREDLWLFCSEQFIETWSQTATELSSGNWVHHIWNDESTQITRSLSQYQIHLKDCLLIDDCQVDIEFPNRTAVKIIQFGDQNCSTHSAVETNPKSTIKTIVNLAASDRYRAIHLIMVLHTTQTFKYLSDVTNLQNAIVKQQGCPCDNLFFQYTQPALLSAVIATISSKHLKNDLLAYINIETRMIERARFLLSIVPTLTAFDCIVLLSKRNVTLKDHIKSMISISCNHEMVRRDSTQQLRAALVTHLDRF